MDAGPMRLSFTAAGGQYGVEVRPTQFRLSANSSTPLLLQTLAGTL